MLPRSCGRRCWSRCITTFSKRKTNHRLTIWFSVSIYVFVSLSVYLSIRISYYCLFVFSSYFFSVCLSIYLSIYLSVCLFLSCLDLSWLWCLEAQEHCSVFSLSCYYHYYYYYYYYYCCRWWLLLLLLLLLFINCDLFASQPNHIFIVSVLVGIINVLCEWLSSFRITVSCLETCPLVWTHVCLDLLDIKILKLFRSY